jgi:cell division septum initiation protein DivIVA
VASFTDIMTVILMVFMLTMVAVIIKNTDLIRQLRQSRFLQARSENQLENKEQVLADLRSRFTAQEETVRSQRMEMILLREELQRLDDNLELKAATIDLLGEENEDLEEHLRLLRLQMTEKQEELDDARMAIAGIRDDAERTNRQLQREIAALLAQLEENETALLTLSNEKSDLELALARQRQDFTSLEDKYLKLVRPARSSLGKEVVSVQYRKRDGRDQYLIRGTGQDAWEELPRSELYSRLGEYKARLGEALYIKVLIPDDSGLSYNEAWDFTKQVLSRFDYYYKDGW